MDSVSLIFFILGILGLSLSLFSYIFGELHDSVPGGFHITDGLDSGHEITFSQFFNMGTLTGGLSGFGFGGLIGNIVFNLNAIKSSFFGLFLSLSIILVLGIIYKKFSKSTYSSVVSGESFIGKNVTIIENIIGSEIGAINILTEDGNTIKYMAKSKGDKNYNIGEVVKIISYSSGLFLIE